MVSSTAWLIFYYVVAKNLPASNSIFFGRIWRRIRAACAKRCFQYCGHDVNVQRGASFGRGDKTSLGDFSSIGVNSEIHGPVTIGARVMMGPEVMIFTQNHATDLVDTPMLDQGYAPARPVVIEDDVWIGARAIVLPGVSVGAGSIIGAGTVVAKSVPARSVAVGNPMRIVRTRE